MAKKLTTEEFIARAKEVHGDKYDYSLVNYIKNCTKVDIICPTHGKFEQFPCVHVKKCGCPKCAVEKTSKARTLTTEEFITKAKEIHGDKYDYSSVKYVDSYTNVIIICKIHGKFEIKPREHIYNKTGCQKCSVEARSLTTEEFISKAKEIHGDKYDYSLTKYVDSRTEVIIKCPIHGEFKQKAAAHIYVKKGCLKCAYEKMLEKNTLATEKFIARAKEIHGDKYDYSLTKYVNSLTEVIIKCPIHGEFKQKAVTHTSNKKSACPKCAYKKVAKENTLTTEEFISRAKEIHGDKYDYSLVKYVHSCEKVIIICKIHGKFEIKPRDHIHTKTGCNKCGIEARSLTTEEFIARAKEIHGDKYDYSLVKYVHICKKVIIICKIHGKFEIRAHNHIYTKNGCKKCAAAKQALTTEEFISMAKETHGDTYDYSLTKYVSARDKVIIICPIHGEFKQIPGSHMHAKNGCPTCKKSMGELAVKKWLSEHNIAFTNQHIFRGCKNINHLRFDFYLPKLERCIEYDGPHHSRPVKFNTKMSDEQAIKNFEATKKRDKIKDEYCSRNTIRMLRIPYKDRHRIDDILNINVR